MCMLQNGRPKSLHRLPTRKALLQFWRGKKMMSLFERKGKVTPTDNFEQAIDKIRDAIEGTRRYDDHKLRITDYSRRHWL